MKKSPEVQDSSRGQDRTVVKTTTGETRCGKD